MTISALDYGFVVLLCFVHFIFRPVVFNFLYWFLIPVFCIFDFWSVD